MKRHKDPEATGSCIDCLEVYDDIEHDPCPSD